MIKNQGEYMPLIDSNINTFDLSVNIHEDRFSHMKGMMILYIGSQKNMRSHAIEFKAGSKVPSKNYKFKYVDAERSSIVLSLYNRKSFWSEDEQIGQLSIAVADFDPSSPETKEIKFENNGPKMTIQASRNENF
ncbi:hypothetical protein TVAG_474910 [Trichomonas vaginalis G3]|uniref:t-SNARE coiled-coil homology domain-containing protein n=1 Tax=Trichomonas vaginalis (strain ATCC PRA-98 / G3) TaxID=412133 RepID=A2ERP1_TRIV3|nr:hypothetical protein TVAGG3_0344810 [Trichomonas vaginalis G3]EAY04693.1 hypothetical protein TVAG_474910 [Trichomonas vaginalis G3]KAI5530897.1 hypothetical protein TVAGG3_0344810 [Trichomonas vaginalis G3]|eukprot:XP_001316916.1 hypothetical protein [Trichomonas vaginalis G3]